MPNSDCPFRNGFDPSKFETRAGHGPVGHLTLPVLTGADLLDNGSVAGAVFGSASTREGLTSLLQFTPLLGDRNWWPEDWPVSEWSGAFGSVKGSCHCCRRARYGVTCL
jgi:hypothetical protein